VADSSNVPVGALQVGAGMAGRMHGVLPVQLNLPTEGLQLSFVGRLVTADGRPELGMHFVPAAWVAPKLNTFWVVVLAFVSTLTIGLILGRGIGELSRGVWVALLVAALVLLVTLFLAAGHLVAFAVAVIAAIGCCLVVWYLRDRPATSGGF
jgi:hypothetical protein